MAAAIVVTATGLYAGTVAERHWHPRSRPLRPVSASSSGASGSLPSPRYTAGNLTLDNKPDPGTVTATWTDPSNGAATPVVSLTTAVGQAVATLTLAPGVTSYMRAGLDPATDYCILVALYPTVDSDSALAVKACTQHNSGQPG